MLANKERLLQAIVHLISNASKFTKQGSVCCVVQKKEDKLLLSVTDTGLGIRKEDQLRVFDKFEQIGDVVVGKPSGMGLGLPLAKQIIEFHSGTIEVESEWGKGSAFFITLPYLPCSSEKQVQASLIDIKKLIDVLQQQSALISAHQGAKKILLVDDDVNTTKYLQAELQDAGYEVMIANSGIQAIQYAKDDVPDLIVLAISMPDIDGFDVAAVLQSNILTKNIPIFVVSAFDKLS